MISTDCYKNSRREGRTVYEAASTFIGSGVEDLEYAGVDIPITEVRYWKAGRAIEVSKKSMGGRNQPSPHGWYWETLLAIDESGKGV